jgi:hypothetical protein
VRGLAGLIVLGNAWESVDVFHALGVALQADSLGFEKNREGGRNTLAYLAWLRCPELIDAGKGSMLPDAPKGEALKRMLRRPFYVMAGKLLDTAFVDLRAEADAWQAARTAFMMGRLKEGRHPDTDRDFWDGYTEHPAPSLPTTSDPEAYNVWQAVREGIILLVIVGVPVLLLGLLAVISAKARRRKAPQPDDWLAESADGFR